MSIIYAYFCDDCGASTREPIDTCPRCNSTDITHAPSYAQVDYDDALDDARLAEIRSPDRVIGPMEREQLDALKVRS